VITGALIPSIRLRNFRVARSALGNWEQKNPKSVVSIDVLFISKSLKQSLVTRSGKRELIIAVQTKGDRRGERVRIVEEGQSGEALLIRAKE
jgi:hypothetical protein